MRHRLGVLVQVSGAYGRGARASRGRASAAEIQAEDKARAIAEAFVEYFSDDPAFDADAFREACLLPK